MKFEVYDSSTVDDEEVLLGLKKKGSDIYLVAVDKAGHTILNGNILKITDEGGFARFEWCFVKGIEVDSAGKIREVK